MAIKHKGVIYATLSDAAKRLGAKPETVSRWIRNGILPKPPVIRVKRRRIRVFPEAYMEEAMKQIPSAARKAKVVRRGENRYEARRDIIMVESGTMGAFSTRRNSMRSR
ncbi:MAG: helix-turn-helix domain-containing protein, partial [Acidobacteriota bacterium]